MCSSPICPGFVLAGRDKLQLRSPPGGLPGRQPRSVSVTVVELAALTDSQRQQWELFRGADPGNLSSPFLSLKFAQAVDRARGDVEVAVISPNLGFFPFHLLGETMWGTSRIAPVGRFLNDAQGIISPRDGLGWSQLSRHLQQTIDLHAAVSGDAAATPTSCLQPVDSFKAQWSDSSGDYLRRLAAEHRTIAKQCQKSRKLEREVGPLRLEVDCRVDAVADRLIAMKRQQYRRTHILDHFAPAWTRRLIDELAVESTDVDCGAENLSRSPLRRLVSVLWAGDRLVAGHLGLIEHGQLHYWFPVYDPDLSAYSPGTALYVQLLAAASDHGIVSIDMGYGDQPYKRKQTTATSTLWKGRITDSTIDRWQARLNRTAASLSRHAPFRPAFKRVLRTLVPHFGISKLR